MESCEKIGTSMSDTKRAELAKKMDDDIDLFIDSLIKQKDSNEPKKPFDYDEWCKEIDQHPVFMTRLQPDKNGEFSEAVQALQALKYDEDEWEDRRATAERHKIDGNKHFKYKKYHWAINRYTDGINQRCTDRYLNSILYANRAAAQKHVGNTSSAFRDCFFARKFDPENIKAIVRGAECLIELGRGKQCIDWLKISKENSKRETSVLYNYDYKLDSDYLNELYTKAQQLALVEERDERKKRQDAAKDLIAKQQLLLAFKERNINFKPTLCFDNPELFEWSQIEVQLTWLTESKKVYLDDCGILHWPILVQYPEIGKVDLITDCSEESSVDDVFSGPLQQTLSDDSNSMFNAELMPWSKIREAFSIPGFIVMQGLPTIQIYTKKHAEANFLKIEDCFYKIK
ncbi:Tetratricopeptide repeat protein [Dirofilaria immitis]